MSLILNSLLGKQLTGWVLDTPSSRSFYVRLSNEEGAPVDSKVKVQLYVKRCAFRGRHFVTEERERESGVFHLSCRWTPELLDDDTFIFYFDVVQKNHVLKSVAFKLPAFDDLKKHKTYRIDLTV